MAFSLFYDNFSDHFLLCSDYKRPVETNPIGVFPSPSSSNSVNVVRVPMTFFKYIKKPSGISLTIKTIFPHIDIPVLLYQFDRDINLNLVNFFYMYVRVFNWFSSLKITLLDSSQNIISVFTSSTIPTFRKMTRINFTRNDNNLLVNVRYIRVSIVTSVCTKIEVFFIGATYSLSNFYDNMTLFQTLSNAFVDTLNITDLSSSANTRVLVLNNTGKIDVFGNSDDISYALQHRFRSITDSPTGTSFFFTISGSIFYSNLNINVGSHTLYIPVFIKRIIGSFNVIVDDSNNNLFDLPQTLQSTGFQMLKFNMNVTTSPVNLRIIFQNNNQLSSTNLILGNLNPTFPTFLVAPDTYNLGLIEGIIFFISIDFS